MKKIDLEKAVLVVRHREISQGLEKYKYFRDGLFETDVSNDEFYQKDYSIFYQTRRFYNNHFADGFFSLYEKAKRKKEIDFQNVFTNMQEIQGICEISFSSKLLHTIEPCLRTVYLQGNISGIVSPVSVHGTWFDSF